MTFLAVNWGNALLITGVGFGLVFLVLVLLIFIVKSFGVIKSAVGLAANEFKKKKEGA